MVSALIRAAMHHLTSQKDNRLTGWVSTSFQVSDLCSRVDRREVIRIKAKGKKKIPNTSKPPFRFFNSWFLGRCSGTMEASLYIFTIIEVKTNRMGTMDPMMRLIKIILLPFSFSDSAFQADFNPYKLILAIIVSFE